MLFCCISDFFYVDFSFENFFQEYYQNVKVLSRSRPQCFVGTASGSTLFAAVTNRQDLLAKFTIPHSQNHRNIVDFGWGIKASY